jgi:FkbM family methyltransferase
MALALILSAVKMGYDMNSALLNWISGRWRLQKVFERLHQFSLAGMGYGVPFNVSEGGEWIAIDRVLQRTKDVGCPIFFDVGANVGDYSLFLRKKLGARGTIHCFEPSRDTFERLQANVRERADIISHNFGLSDKAGSCDFFSVPGRSPLSSVYKRNLRFCEIDMSQIETSRMETLDDFCESNSIKHISLLKIDVEGHEFNVLSGAARMLKERRISFIQFEFGGCNIDSRIFFRDFWYMLNESYQIFRIIRGGLVPVMSYDEHLEIFMYVNFFAELRAQ